VLIGLVAISGAPGAPRLALRAYDQLTGLGPTASAITVNWTAGLLNAQNQPLAGDTTDLSPDSDRSSASPSSPLSFMYGDFKNLSVTVSQTENITNQGIGVSWTGGVPSANGAPFANFLQIMECYGDASAGPSPEACQYGTRGLLPPGAGHYLGDRAGLSCGAGTAPSTASPPAGPAGDPSTGCDPAEPGTETPAHCDPNAGAAQSCAAGNFSIPFVPADDPAGLVYQQNNLTRYFSNSSTNEVQAAYTAADGTGQHQFETLTAGQSPGLGCGETESNGQTRDCWLVIVPRGSYEPNGYQVSPTASGLLTDGKLLDSSPLSAANWAQRIQIHLGYAPVSPNCPATSIPDEMVGTQLIDRAVRSWQQQLNQQAQCSKVYAYTASAEDQATVQLQHEASGAAGLAFTTIPIGSEATRHGGSPPALPNILYAPVAVTALDFGFNVDEASHLTTPVKLTPALVARSATQAYKSDLPNWDPQVAGLPGPAWAQGNPQSILYDPAFQSINPEIAPLASANSFAPLLTGDQSADNQRVWEWVQSDTGTASWLDGGTSSSTVTVNPAYPSHVLGNSPAADVFLQADGTDILTCAEVNVNAAAMCGPGQLNRPPLLTYELDPREYDFDQAAAAVATGNDPGYTRTWSATGTGPDGTPGWFAPAGTELPGQTFMWAMNDMPDLAAYGLVSAALCDPAAAGCVQPGTASVTAALNSATPDSAGLLQVNPATVPAGAYPLVDVVYAAVPVNQTAQALSDYANFISYAAGQGQTPGTAAGDLPPGYLPLPASLQAQAQSVATQLRTLAATSPAPDLKVTVSPSTPAAGQNATLTATLTGPNGTPAGTVQFWAGGTAVGGPVTLSPQGTASTAVVFTFPGLNQLTATYTPGAGNYTGTSLTTTVRVLPAGALSTGNVPLAVAAPVTGSFSLTVQTQGVVTLTTSADGSSATGVTPPIVVDETQNTYPGWSVTGQAASFTGSGTAAGGSMPGNQLGWTPAASPLAAGAVLGPVVAPGSPGLGSTAAVLADAPAGNGNGFGTTSLDPALLLAIPPTVPAGPYAGSVTISAIVGFP
jgi:hypothetical protein